MTYHQRADWLLDRARDAEAVGNRKLGQVRRRLAHAFYLRSWSR